MSSGSQTPVQSAFEQLLEEIEEEFADVNTEGSDAFKGGNYDRAQAFLKRAGDLSAFRDKVVALRGEWEALVPRIVNPPSHPQVQAKLRKGLRTPEVEYYQPILRALDEHGGSANINTVLQRVHEFMKDKLNQYDHEPLNSDRNQPRWRNAAQWARDAMVKQGLLRNDSPTGTWELTDAGRSRLGK
jgi:hypothetical protein